LLIQIRIILYGWEIASSNPKDRPNLKQCCKWVAIALTSTQ